MHACTRAHTYARMYIHMYVPEISPPFSLFMAHPRSLLPFSDESLLPYKDALIMVEAEDSVYDQKVLDVLFDTMVRPDISFH